MHCSSVPVGSLLVDVPGMHDVGREVRREALSVRRLAVGTSSAGARADGMPGPLLSGLLHVLDSVRRALDAEAAALDRVADAVDAAAHEYVVQEMRAASALAG